MHHRQVIDSEGLQADVMRFMAIIAFCLIAILALVKQIEPLSETNVVEQSARPQKDGPVPLPEAARESAAAQPDSESVLPVAEAPVEKTQPEAPPTEDGMPLPEDDTGQVETALRFESDRAFLELVSGDVIRLYNRSRKRFVRLTPELRTKEASPKSPLYELVESQVPLSIRNLLPAGTKLVWLPEDMQLRLQNLLNSRTVVRNGGTLVINADRSVHHEA